MLAADRRRGADVRRLYFWDLTGAALGCLLAVPLQATIGQPAMILLVAGRWRRSVSSTASEIRPTARRRDGGTGLAVAVVLGARHQQLRGADDETKTLDDRRRRGRLGRRLPRRRGRPSVTYVLHHDGLWGSAIWRYDGTPRDHGPVRHRRPPDPVRRAGLTTEPHVLIIGAAGGNEIQAALTYGAGQIDAVELNPVTHHLLTGPFAEYSGNIANLPDVNYVEGDGRTFLARDDDYDLDLVRRARLVRRLQRRHGWRVRDVGELPLHPRDDRDRLRPPLPRRRDGRAVRGSGLRHPADAHGALPRHRQGDALAGESARTTSTTTLPSSSSSAGGRSTRSTIVLSPTRSTPDVATRAGSRNVPMLALYLPGGRRTEEGITSA